MDHLREFPIAPEPVASAGLPTDSPNLRRFHHGLCHGASSQNAGGFSRHSDLRRNAEIERVAGLLVAREHLKSGRVPMLPILSPLIQRPSLYIGRARHLSCTDLPREFPQLVLPGGAIPDRRQPLLGHPSQFRKQRDIRRGAPNARCYANISLPSREAYDREHCSRSRYSASQSILGRPEQASKSAQALLQVFPTISLTSLPTEPIRPVEPKRKFCQALSGLGIRS
jgi:hypothetical protein